MSSSSSSCTRIKVFDFGKYTVELLRLSDQSTRRNNCKDVQGTLVIGPPPKPLLIATPTQEGKFPVLVFLHGYLLFNSFYSHLIQHVASHGFIVVAPQLYDVVGPDSTEEIKATAAVTIWLAQGLQHELPTLVQPNLTKLGIAGHSRGDKVAFAFALKQHKMISNTSLKYSALMGIDPIDGMGKGSQTPPPVLTYVPRSFDLNMAVMVVGSGLGELKKNPLFPPCAPKGVNHRDFFDECCSPACYFVVKDYGHLDMLDDETRGMRGRATYCICKNGKAREPMRRFVAGVMVAFTKAYLEDNHDDLLEIRKMREGNSTLPVELETMDFRI